MLLILELAEAVKKAKDVSTLSGIIVTADKLTGTAYGSTDRILHGPFQKNAWNTVLGVFISHRNRV